MSPAERVAALEEQIAYGGRYGFTKVTVSPEQAKWFASVAKAAVAWRGSNEAEEHIADNATDTDAGCPSCKLIAAIDGEQP